jgi:hypothetical protein
MILSITPASDEHPDYEYRARIHFYHKGGRLYVVLYSTIGEYRQHASIGLEFTYSKRYEFSEMKQP